VRLYRKEKKNSLAIMIIFGLMVSACSLDQPKPRQIRAHTDLIDGVAHAFPALKGPRYCQECHGASLAGGSAGQPSCWQCHGENWTAISPDTSLAPADHTVLMGGYRHHPNYQSPNGTCETCHGANLAGDGRNGHPSCYLCHGAVWQN